MPKIQITSDRRPWVGGKARDVGEILDVSEFDAEILENRGLGEIVKPAPRRAKKDDADDE